MNARVWSMAFTYKKLNKLINRKITSWTQNVLCIFGYTEIYGSISSTGIYTQKRKNIQRKKIKFKS